MVSPSSKESGDPAKDSRAEPTVPLGGPDTTQGLQDRSSARGGDSLPTIPGFTIIGELGRGAMGVVYEAHQSNLNRTVALKLVPSTDKSMVMRFELEARALGKVQDDGIIRIFDVGHHEGRPYLVMEVVRGGTLAQALGGNVVVDARDAALVVRQMAKSLGAAHGAGILHRDLKPGNIMLAEPPPPPDDLGKIRLDKIHTKLADFGLAKEINKPGSSSLTQTGAVMGTPGYMAPEQALGCNRTLTPATDIHALGAILYEMLTGNPPFRGESPLETIRMVADQDPLPPRKVRSGIPVDLETICLKCLQKNPSRRYQSTADLINDLDSFLEHRTILARRTPLWEKAGKWCLRNPLRATSVAFVVLGFLVSMGIWGYLNNLREKSDNDKLVELQENLGFERVWSNDITKAMVWFAAALEHERRPDRIPISRFRIGAMMDAFPWIRSYVVHTQAVKGADWSPSGRYYLSYGDDRSITINDPTLGGKPTRVKCRIDPVGNDPDLGFVTVKFLTDGIVLILDESEWLYAWEWEKESTPRNLRKGVTALAVDGPNSRWAIASGDAGIVVEGTREDLRSETLETRIRSGKKLGNKILELSFIGPQKGILFRKENGMGRLKPDGAIHVYRGFRGVPSCMAVALDGAQVAVGTELGEVRVWSLDSEQPRPGNLGHREKVLCLGFNNQGTLLASGSMDQRVSVRDTSTGYLKYQVPHEGDVTCLAFSQNPELLYTGSEDNTIRTWHAETGRPAASQLVYNATLRTVVVHPTAPLLLGGSDDNTCCLWDTKPKNRVVVRPLDSMDQFALGAGPQGQLLVMRSETKAYLANMAALARVISSEPGRFLNLETGPLPLSLDPLPLLAKSVAIRPGSGAWVLGTDGSVSLWNDRREMVAKPLGADPERAMAKVIHASPKGQYFVIEWNGKGHHKILKIFTEAGVELPWASIGHVRCWAISPDDRFFALGEGRGNLVVSQLGGADPTHSKEAVARKDRAHIGGISCIAFCPDGNWIATGGEDMRIHLWKTSDASPASWKQREAPHHAAMVGSIGFDASGRRVLSSGEDNTLRTWKASNGDSLGDPMLHNSSVLEFLPWHQERKKDQLDLTSSVTTEGSLYFWNVGQGQLLAPLYTPVGSSIRGFGFLDNAGHDPVAIFGCSLGSITLVRLQPAPEWAAATQLRRFAEYHPAFGLNPTGTALLAISGYQIPKLMNEVLKDFESEFPPLPPLFSSKGTSP